MCNSTTASKIRGIPSCVLANASLRSAAQPLKNLYFLENEAGEFDGDAMDTGDSDDEASQHWDTDEGEDQVDHIVL